MSLHFNGLPGDRVVRDDTETPVLAEITAGVWMPLMPCRTWEEWRQLAQSILDAPVPEMAGAG